MFRMLKKFHLLTLLIFFQSCQTFQESNFDITSFDLMKLNVPNLDLTNFDLGNLNFFENINEKNENKEKKLIGDNFLDFVDEML